MYFFLFGENRDIWTRFFVCMLLPPHLAIEHTGLYRYDSYYLKYYFKISRWRGGHIKQNTQSMIKYDNETFIKLRKKYI